MPVELLRLKKRSDFLRVASSKRRFVIKSMVIQYTKQNLHDELNQVPASIGLGFTVTKKQGNAVIRNRIRRRLKEAANIVFSEDGKKGYDYVIIGRLIAKDRPFGDLVNDMRFSLKHIHKAHSKD